MRSLCFLVFVGFELPRDPPPNDFHRFRDGAACDFWRQCLVYNFGWGFPCWGNQSFCEELKNLMSIFIKKYAVSLQLGGYVGLLLYWSNCQPDSTSSNSTCLIALCLAGHDLELVHLDWEKVCCFCSCQFTGIPSDSTIKERASHQITRRPTAMSLAIYSSHMGCPSAAPSCCFSSCFGGHKNGAGQGVGGLGDHRCSKTWNKVGQCKRMWRLWIS